MKNTVSFFELLFPDLIFRNGFIAKASANKNNKLVKLSLNIPTLNVHQQIFKNISIQSHNLSNEIVLTGDCQSYWLASDTLSFLNTLIYKPKQPKTL
jgi:hypothetical protein